MTKFDESVNQFRRTLSRDMQDLYVFYLDEERRKHLAGMKWFKRWVHIIWWLLQSLILKLPPARRIIFILCLILFFMGTPHFMYTDLQFNLNLQPFAFFGLLIVLMLELKDKLLVREEIEAGRVVQLSLMPERKPNIPGWDVWLFTRPANDVGGDLVDYLKIDPERWAIILGDVSGKGLAAALLMAKLQATIRALASSHDSFAKLGAQLNQIFYRDGILGKFATVLYLEVKPDSTKIRVLNAGHIPPIVLDTQGVHTLPPIAIPLGAFPDAQFIEQELETSFGALFIAYSDGLTDARNEQEEFFGEERFNALLPQLQGLTAEQAGNIIKTEVEKFMGEARAYDDFSLVILRKA